MNQKAAYSRCHHGLAIDASHWFDNIFPKTPMSLSPRSLDGLSLNSVSLGYSDRSRCQEWKKETEINCPTLQVAHQANHCKNVDVAFKSLHILRLQADVEGHLRATFLKRPIVQSSPWTCALLKPPSSVLTKHLHGSVALWHYSLLSAD